MFKFYDTLMDAYENCGDGKAYYKQFMSVYDDIKGIKTKDSFIQYSGLLDFIVMYVNTVGGSLLTIAFGSGYKKGDDVFYSISSNGSCVFVGQSTAHCLVEKINEIEG